MQTKKDSSYLEIDDLVFVTQGERSGRGILRDVFSNQALVDMLGGERERVLVHRNNIMRVQTHPAVN